MPKGTPKPPAVTPAFRTQKDEWSWSKDLLFGDWHREIDFWEKEQLRPASIAGAFNRRNFIERLNDLVERERRHSTAQSSSHQGIKQLPWMPESDAFTFVRAYVDEWLDSGRTAHEGESPRRRNLHATQGARNAIAGFSAVKGNKFSFKPISDGVELEFEDWPLPGLKYPHNTPREEANWLFALFMMSDLRFTLAKCKKAECGCYFEVKQRNRTYTLGTYCPVCRRVPSRESAKRRTSETRDDAERTLYRLAAKRFARRIRANEKWRDDAGLKSAIIGHLNREIERREGLSRVYPHGVTPKWLAWEKNRKGIEAAIERTSHAESERA